MNKEEMTFALARKARLTKRDAEAAIDAVFDIITDTLVSGGKVQIVGFGNFETKDRAPRVGRNPKANTPVKIPARRVPVFNPGKPLRDAVDNAKSLNK